MKAERINDEVRLTLSPQEAHVLIWGGPVDLIGQLDSEQRSELVRVEDDDFTDDEYQHMFGDLTAMYSDLKAEL